MKKVMSEIMTEPLALAKENIDNGRLEELISPKPLFLGIHNSDSSGYGLIPTALFVTFYAPDEYFEKYKDKIAAVIQKDDYLLAKYALYKYKDSSHLFIQDNDNKIGVGFKRLEDMGFGFDFVFEKSLVKEFFKRFDLALYYDDLGATSATFFSNDKKAFQLVLELGANPSRKTELLKQAFSEKEHFEFFKNSCSPPTKAEYERHIRKQGSNDQLDCVEYCIKNKCHGAISILNKRGIIKNQAVDSFEVDINKLVEAVNIDNKDILDKLENYKDIVFNQKVNGKNLLFYAIERSNLDCVKKIVENNMVSKDDVGGAKQQALSHAINKKKAKIAEYLYENNWFSDDTLTDKRKQYEIFTNALFNMVSFAAKMEVDGKIPVPVEMLDYGFKDVYDGSKYNKIKAKLQKEFLDKNFKEVNNKKKVKI